MFRRKPRHQHEWKPISRLRRFEDRNPQGYLSDYGWTTWLERYCACGRVSMVRVAWHDNWNNSQLLRYLDEVYPNTAPHQAFKK